MTLSTAYGAANVAVQAAHKRMIMMRTEHEVGRHVHSNADDQPERRARSRESVPNRAMTNSPTTAIRIS
jgi:hypothetical protein